MFSRVTAVKQGSTPTASADARLASAPSRGEMKNLSTSPSTSGFPYSLAGIPISTKSEHPDPLGRIPNRRLPFPLQAKLQVGAVNDPLEAEADRVADQVMRMPAPDAATPGDKAGSAAIAAGLEGITTGDLQRKCDCGGTCDHCKKKQQDEHAKVQMKASAANVSGGFEAPPIVHEVLSSPGQPLDKATRDFMEPRFGHDFSHVRVHTDAKAAESARAVGARAYTVGSNVVFGSGEYGPGTQAGQRLLGHELAHVLQQGEPQDVQRQPAPTRKQLHADTKLVFEAIQHRDSELAKLITPESIDLDRGTKEPPAIKSGSHDKEEHVWKVYVIPAGAVSITHLPTTSRLKVKGSGELVTHSIRIEWARSVLPDAEFEKQFGWVDLALILTHAEPLYHELLHAQIIMERDPGWTAGHSNLFQGYQNILQIAASAAVDPERRELKKQIWEAAAGTHPQIPAAALTALVDEQYEFLVHEKYDADIEGKAFSKTYPNALIAKRYVDEVAKRIRVTGIAFMSLRKNLTDATEKLYSKLDQASRLVPESASPTAGESGPAKPGKTSAPTSPNKATPGATGGSATSTH